MHAVIGTAGHVDHGKSALIQALTGIHPSHLPQELDRGMTIDLGFAHFTSPQGDKIGIIDVPGHERFIRNMVSSVWGLDMVLFIVAADAGWAALSEEHLRVIAAMNVKRTLIVITKCDLADEKRITEVENDILEHFISMTDSLPEVVHVSAHTGQGIDTLKQRIIENLNQLDLRNNLNPHAHLYVDRVFSINGVGTTVTGTLRAQSIKEGDVLTLFPGQQTVRVRSLQSYHEQQTEVQPYSRVAIGLKQVNKKSVSRGSCLTTAPNAITVSTDWIVQLNPKFSELKKQSELEVALGTAHTQAKCYVFADGQLARLQLKEPMPAFWGQPLLLIQHGGSRIIGAGRLAWMHTLNKQLRAALQEALPTLEINSSDQAAHLSLQLALNGYASQNVQLTPLENTVTLGPWWVTHQCQQTVLTQCNDILMSAINAVSIEEFSRQTGYPETLIDALATAECDNNNWKRIQGGIVSIQAREDGGLPADQANILEQIQQAGSQGFDTAKTQHPGIQRILRALTERKLIVPTVDKLFFSTEVYETLLTQIMQNRQLGDEFGVADARDRTGLARKQLIPLFNRLERDGWLRRVGDNRIVCKLLPQEP